MKKIYYDKNNGYLCNRYPNNIPIKEDSLFIEVDDETYENTFAVETGKFWAVINGKLQVVENKFITETREWKISQIEKSIREKQEYLTNTDYIIVKINEAIVEDDKDLADLLKEKYKLELAKRKQLRSEINDLQDQLLKF